MRDSTVVHSKPIKLFAPNLICDSVATQWNI
jgi:hypothetical protein